ncbi:MAG: 4Fe-4S binding protein [Syntrophaceae bacterium]|nr:4Fe-4S binding protein [Syntrophaceae bacterium]
MKIQAELSLYPLKTDLIEDAVKNFIKELSKSEVSVVPGQMSTLVAGQSGEIFRVIGECFEKACRTDEIVLVVKFSNACPEKATGKEDGITTSISTARGLKTTDLRKGSITRMVKIDESKCTGCGICIQVCPVKAITVERVAKINQETCTGCGSCVAECPSEAIFMERLKPASPSRVNHTPSSHISATRVATSPARPQVFSNQPGFQQVNRSSGLLKQIFDFFRSSAGKGGGQGRGRGGGGGRGKGRRT